VVRSSRLGNMPVGFVGSNCLGAVVLGIVLVGNTFLQIVEGSLLQVELVLVAEVLVLVSEVAWVLVVLRPVRLGLAQLVVVVLVVALLEERQRFLFWLD